MRQQLGAPEGVREGAGIEDVRRAEVAVGELLEDLMTRTVESLRVDTVAVLLLDESGEILVARAAKGLEEEVERSVRIPVGAGFAGRVAATRRPVIVEDVREADILNPLLLEKGLESLLGVPIEVEDKLLGVLHVGSVTRREFSDAEVHALELIADEVAVPVMQAQLYGAERDARRQLEVVRRQLAFLADASAVLASSLDYETTLASVARLAVPELADWCVIDVVTEAGSVRRVAVVCADPGKEEMADELRRSYPARPARPEGTSKVLRTGSSELVRDVTEPWLDAIAPDERQREILSALGLRSNILVPLVARGRTLGVLTLATAESGRRYGDPELRLAEDLAGRAALAVDNARLYRAALENESKQRFLAEAGSALASSLDFHTTLQQVAHLAVPAFADWCIVDLVEGDQIQRVAVAAANEASQEALEELRHRYPPTLDSPQPAARALRERKPVLFDEFTPESLAETVRDEYHHELIQRLGPRSAIAVPLVARGHVVGAITFAWAQSGRRYTDADLPLAEEIARRSALAVDNARLHRETEERARAALVLMHVGDGVFMVDQDGVVRLWNPAAEAITGLPASQVVGGRADEIIPGWSEVAALVPVGPATAPAPQRAETLPLEIDGRELWLSITGAALEEGTVYAFRDLTEERALEKMRSDFVATISHELRTPLASVYGAALTLLQRDASLEGEQRTRLLGVIASEADRLAKIVNDILLANRLDSDTLAFSIESCDALEVVDRAVEAARAHLPPHLELRATAAKAPLAVAADQDKLRQILGNLIDNAVKYSPEQGVIGVGVEQKGTRIRFSVSDEGIGIAPEERERIFEKFYRLDPELLRGVGGTGLGLYISRELARRMDGTIWVDSEPGQGSTFCVELPLAELPGLVPVKSEARA